MRASIGDVALHYEVAGDSGPPLILLHGGPGADHILFKTEFSALADVARGSTSTSAASVRNGVAVVVPRTA